MNHSYPEIAEIRKLSLGEGGQTLLLAAGKPPFYAGRRRAATNYSFEAALTLLEHPAYREIIAATASGRHVPQLPVDDKMTTGVMSGVWQMRGPAPTMTAPPAPKQGLAPEARFDFAGRSKEGKSGGPRTLRNLQNMGWVDRCTGLMEEIEHRAGWEWRISGNHRRLGPAVQRLLFIVDDKILYPPHHTQLREGDWPNQHQLATLRARFANLPGIIQDTKVDLVILCNSLESAAALQQDRFVEHWLDGSDQQQLVHGFPPFHWPDTPIFAIPSLNDNQPFGRFFTGARSDQALYNVLRTVPPGPPPSPLDELRSMVGMNEVIQRLEKLEAAAIAEQERQHLGLPSPDFSLNAVLYGNPGTGKTTVAKMIGRIYSELGFISGTKFTKVQREELVGSYVGQTAPKTRAACEEAMGGVLFIDEAYSLNRGGENDFGKEAVDELLRWMSESRRDLAVIFAGYPAEMKSFLRINPGLARRVMFHIPIRDYTDTELVQIAEVIAARTRDRIEKRAEEVILEKIRAQREACQIAGQAFGNAGEVEKLVKAAIISRAMRLRGSANQDRDEWTLLRIEDFQDAELDAPSPSR